MGLYFFPWLLKYFNGWLNILPILFPPIGSWSSASSREGSQPQADCTAWAKTDQDEMSSRSPDTNSCSSPIEEPRSYMVLGNQPNHNDDGTAVSHMEANPRKMPVTNTPKAKARATFSDSQMNILSERFSMQRYLSPSEMRGLAEVTKLTYKQVRRLMDSKDDILEKIFKKLKYTKLLILKCVLLLFER